ncbi:SgcJ/EcaC family oxidoreductase [Methylocystis sp. H4A]|uniref:YybH family protein n=1 Tax=Methylocystis sp. H4A TaxID=2785788 RepID=UPI0018C316C6|nr:SgcJ/EcaC family oxidoreductase [Methylocystis sp. H4A]MBG0801513.1 SgcJ/EcaC family oxidoreductase [Methylocystis sp. H4A]MBG0801989.1 SgcJ/EcaC family oxidoreductase [Methylocystis sp. H4A]
MTDDERAIRELVDAWMVSSKAGDLTALIDLMTDDVIFLTPGGKPFGKEAFVAASKNMKNVAIEARSEIQELCIFGDWAYMRSYIEMTATPRDGGAPLHRTGNTLTILRKEADGRWRLARDANLLAAEKS